MKTIQYRAHEIENNHKHKGFVIYVKKKKKQQQQKQGICITIIEQFCAVHYSFFILCIYWKL